MSDIATLMISILESNVVSQATVRKIQRWLVNDTDMEEKDRALQALWGKICESHDCSIPAHFDKNEATEREEKSFMMMQKYLEWLEDKPQTLEILRPN